MREREIDREKEIKLPSWKPLYHTEFEISIKRMTYKYTTKQLLK